jgi:hypothetical protein
MVLQWLKRPASPFPTAPQQSAHSSRYRPWLEALEDRTVLDA